MPIPFINVMTFPEKLFLVANDDFLVRWTNNGAAVQINPDMFVEEVMTVYEGFVKKSSFTNLRRLFREYGFDWTVTPKKDEYIFSHCYFRRNIPELVARIKTKRKLLIRRDERLRKGGSFFDVFAYFLQLAKDETVDPIPPPNILATSIGIASASKKNRKRDHDSTLVNTSDDIFSPEAHDETINELFDEFNTPSSENLNYIRDSLYRNEFIDTSQLTINDQTLVGYDFGAEVITLSEIQPDCCLNSACFVLETKNSNGNIETGVTVTPTMWPCPCVTAYLNGLSNPNFIVVADDSVDATSSSN